MQATRETNFAPSRTVTRPCDSPRSFATVAATLTLPIIARGLDVLALPPSQFLSESEIAAAARADGGGVFNPQQQFPVQWPAEPVVALAYLGQLERGGELSESLGAQLTAALDRSEAQLQDGGSDEDLAAGLEALAAPLNDNRGDGLVGHRDALLSQTRRGIAARLH